MLLMNAVELKIFAKINLSLNILGKRGDMHLLDMVLASINVFDAISVCLRSDNKIDIDISDKSIPQEKNSVIAAVLAIKERIGEFGADIRVKKNIPVAGGMGGSSADAAGVILALDRLLGLKEKGVNLNKIAQKTGSDTAYMLSGGYKRIGGTGEIIEEIESNIGSLNLLLACPDSPSLTASVYKEFDKIYPSKSHNPSDNEALIGAIKGGDISQATNQLQNALYVPAAKLCPEIEAASKALWRQNPIATFMTGSGSTVVGIFKTKEELECAQAALKEQKIKAIPATTQKKGYEFIN